MDETVRAWWREWLGAYRDPNADWTLGPIVDSARGWRRYACTLRSYASSLPCALLRPRPTEPAEPEPGPAVVVPFYDVPTVLGQVSARVGGVARPGQAYARELVARGVAVLAVPWWFEHVTPASAPTSASLAARYGPSAERHARELPGITGLGRSIADLLAAVDGLSRVPWIDPGRIGVFGHSLGGKLSLHLAALDTRIAAAVAHEPGLGFGFSNWSDPWYLDGHVPADRDQDELVGLVAPRPLLLVGGGDSDGPHNRHLVERGRRAYALAGAASALEILEHHAGHGPPDDIRAACYAWLLERLDARPVSA